MNWIVFSALLIVFLHIGGCSGERRATELLETARFEENQHNMEHVTKLYNEIVQNYPRSLSAKFALKRLSELKRQKP